MWWMNNYNSGMLSAEGLVFIRAASFFFRKLLRWRRVGGRVHDHIPTPSGKPARAADRVPRGPTEVHPLILVEVLKGLGPVILWHNRLRRVIL